MPKSFGRKARTRQMFAKGFRQHGMPSLEKYMTVYKVGDIVDVKVDNAIHKGQPYRYYHGRTGRVFNVTKSSVGVEFFKRVKYRLLRKRINIRVEHVRQSRSREGFLKRVAANESLKNAAKAAGKPKPLTKRQPQPPREGRLVKNVAETDFIRPEYFSYKL
mmetsp:Transcript_42771/g.87415  ORF Transcript_42771/g.87415 Transcript_42771/m.87415 type:complete len:161 (-) Transcript_42771:17-499(-)|eukprot:CAMPEP_0181323880 /NCGR_PEP_ID=MMETSP1101-20121128/20041_1 /TAXON_ID=46948 /ORGANISM="Rhodomonas abbreviata, Strain Caron Lab Isolate" /LENGTH=160 /DNA_ID=CAMNT_0023431977 /DNA_START=64 /DNA_END=546 /DNA_ORIENTATION=+